MGESKFLFMSPKARFPHVWYQKASDISLESRRAVCD